MNDVKPIEEAAEVFLKLKMVFFHIIILVLNVTLKELYKFFFVLDV